MASALRKSQCAKCALNFDEEGVLREVARLSGGQTGSSVSISHAKELRETCNNYKKGI